LLVNGWVAPWKMTCRAVSTIQTGNGLLGYAIITWVARAVGVALLLLLLLIPGLSFFGSR